MSKMSTSPHENCSLFNCNDWMSPLDPDIWSNNNTPISVPISVANIPVSVSISSNNGDLWNILGMKSVSDSFGNPPLVSGVSDMQFFFEYANTIYMPKLFPSGCDFFLGEPLVLPLHRNSSYISLIGTTECYNYNNIYNYNATITYDSNAYLDYAKYFQPSYPYYNSSTPFYPQFMSSLLSNTNSIMPSGNRNPPLPNSSNPAKFSYPKSVTDFSYPKPVEPTRTKALAPPVIPNPPLPPTDIIKKGCSFHVGYYVPPTVEKGDLYG